MQSVESSDGMLRKCSKRLRRKLRIVGTAIVQLAGSGGNGKLSSKVQKGQPMKFRTPYVVTFAVLMLAISTFAQEAYVYPGTGQTPEQMAKDKGDCATWAKQQTGFDPSQ